MGDAYVFLIVSLILAIPVFTQTYWGRQPQQIHIAYGRNPSEMVVKWSTKDITNMSVVRYGLTLGKMTHLTEGTSHIFVDGAPAHWSQYIHTVNLTDLIPGTTYFYLVGSKYGWSKVFNFTAMPDGNKWSPRIVMFGDMGSINAQSLPRLLQEVDMYDALLHIGDFAYDMATDNGTIGDTFMNLIQPIATHLPYMTCPGNHENAYNFSHYKNRFSMPSDTNGDQMFYSFDIGPAHIVSISTEYYFYLNYGFMQAIRQYEWLEQDLQKASLPENRAKRPWIILMGHRPMYCSNNNGNDCTKKESRVRIGIPFLEVGGLEKMLCKYGVDITLWAHEHSYERLWPVYNWEVCNGSYNNPYTNPAGPLHIITGSAGCQERHAPFIKTPEFWSAYRNSDYGYTRMHIHNSTHVHFQQVSDDKEGAIVDDFYLIKDEHKRGCGPCHK